MNINTKQALAIAALLITSHAFSMENLVQKRSCPPEAGDCPSIGAGSGTGGHWMGATDFGAGGHTDYYSDSLGEWWVETSENGDMQVGTAQDYGQKSAMKIIKPATRPDFKNMKMTKGPMKTYAIAQAAAQAASNAANAAKAAAAKAAADKASAEAEKVAAAKKAAEAAEIAAANKAAGVYSGPAVGVAGNGKVVLGSARKP